jgi:hypothetical protein
MDRAAESIAEGGGKYMTSEGTYRHLNMLENWFPKLSASSLLACPHLTRVLLQRKVGTHLSQKMVSIHPVVRHYLLPGVSHVIRAQAGVPPTGWYTGH